MNNEPIELELSQFSTFLKNRPIDTHKGDYGHVLIVGGNIGYSGAVRLAAEAALRTGAGLVSIATHAAHAAFLNQTRPEVMCHPIHVADELQSLIAKASVIVLGPGLGCNEWSRPLWSAVMTSGKPLVVDADGLNLLAEQPKKNSHWILTPHPGEAARLLRQTTQVVQQNRLLALTQLQKNYAGVVVLKGAGSLVLDDQDEPSISHFGNPGMATAGMGDVLSGVISSLVAQGNSLVDSAKLGVLLHAMAGDLAANAGQRGMIASDLMPYLRQLVNEQSSC